MPFHQAIAIAAFSMRKLSEAVSPKRKRTNTGGYRNSEPSSPNKLSRASSNPPPTTTWNAILSTGAPMVSSLAHVFESDIRLLPYSNCLESHGKGKAPLRNDRDTDEKTSRDCGYSTYCEQAFLSPQTAITEDYRLETSDPLHDLKRWVTSPNQRISGEEFAHRVAEASFITRSPRFKEHTLAKCLLWAAEEVKQLHSHVLLQINYLRDSPYTWKFCENPIKDANPLHTLPTSTSLKGLDRCELVHLLAEMATEVDYLQEQICFVRKETLQVKWEMAKGGDWGEIMDLIESGLVNVENVQKECSA